MLARILYAAVLLALLGAFPRAATVRVHEEGSRAPGPAFRPAWTPRPGR